METLRVPKQTWLHVALKILKTLQRRACNHKRHQAIALTRALEILLLTTVPLPRKSENKDVHAAGLALVTSF